MVKFIHFLDQHKVVNIALGVMLYLLVTLPHEFVGVTIAGFFKGVPRVQYDLTILVIGVVILFSFGVYLFIQVKKLERPSYPITFFIFCLASMIASLHMLIIVNIEIIHFIQYALLAVLLFPLSKSFFTTMVMVTFLGAMDEAYQYYYLSPERTNYYDFNDVILNLLGAAMGMIFLRSHKGIATLLSDNISQFKKTWIFYFAIIFLLTAFVWQKNVIQSILQAMKIDLDWADYGAILIRKPTTSFWTLIQPNDMLYHVVQPVAGLVIVTILLFIFSFLHKHAE